MGGGRERGRKGISKGGRDRGRLITYYKGREGARKGEREREGEREGERRRLLQREGGRNGGYYKGTLTFQIVV